jgi:hypothetical protein
VSRQQPTAGPTDEQRRRIRRSAILLATAALAIYVTFIASGMLGWRG